MRRSRHIYVVTRPGEDQPVTAFTDRGELAAYLARPEVDPGKLAVWCFYNGGMRHISPIPVRITLSEPGTESQGGENRPPERDFQGTLF